MSEFVTMVPEPSEPQLFVKTWKQAYQADRLIYDQNIRLGSLLDRDNVERLMRWKAGRRFRTSATAFAMAVPLETLNSRRDSHGTLTDVEITELYDEIMKSLRTVNPQRTGNIIWPIFLCHVAHPQGTPIYDVNVWRAWGYIAGWIKSLHFEQRPTRFDTYLEFRKWHNELVVTHGLEQQELDQALMAFGQFLSSRWGRFMLVVHALPEASDLLHLPASQ